MFRCNNLIIIYLDDVSAYIHICKDDINDYLKANKMDLTDFDSIEDCATYFINCDLDLLKENIINFDMSDYDKILVEAKIGTWRGSFSGHAYYVNLYNAVIDNMQDVNIVFYDRKNTTLQLKASHHDGDNTFKFYKIVKGKKRAIKSIDFLLYR